jgi:hypothetical protein
MIRALLITFSRPQRRISALETPEATESRDFERSLPATESRTTQLIGGRLAQNDKTERDSKSICF